MFGGEGGPKRGNVQAKLQDVLMNLEIYFMDAIYGATNKFHLIVLMFARLVRAPEQSRVCHHRLVEAVVGKDIRR